MGDRLLDLYFRLLEKLARRLPPPRLWRLVYLTGALFRPASYLPLLRQIQANLAPYYPPEERKRLLREMFIWESRLTAENALLGQEPKATRASFQHQPPRLPAPCLVATGHFFNYWLLIELLRVTDQPVVLLMGDRPRGGSPAEDSGWRAWQRWRRQQSFLYASEGGAYQRCQEILAQGRRLLLLFDVPWPNGVPGSLLGQRVRLPIGGWRLATRINVPVHLLFPLAENPLRPYGLLHQPLSPAHHPEELLASYLRTLEEIISRYPSSWMGWLYLHRFAEDRRDQEK